MKTLIALGLVIGLVVGCVASPSKPKPVDPTAKCVDDAMQSYSKRQTAEMAMALQFKRMDKDHLIPYITTREAVKVVYCSK